MPMRELRHPLFLACVLPLTGNDKFRNENAFSLSKSKPAEGSYNSRVAFTESSD